MSDSTTRRTLTALGTTVMNKIARVRAKVRRRVWTLLELRPGGFPWLAIAGKRLHRWIVIGMDATIITAASRKEGATGTFKKSFGHPPLAAWCVNTGECLAMLLRPGNAGSSTASGRIRVLSDALAQTPGQSSAKLLVRVDGAGPPTSC
ncbi:transposase [Streptomyces sp. NPDC127051]|uniref:transposase n=1 Tax=Streptomyces sp. NPDC127051 TaxID=3347119 RepID=UPI003646B17F